MCNMEVNIFFCGESLNTNGDVFYLAHPQARSTTMQWLNDAKKQRNFQVEIYSRFLDDKE